MYSFLSLGNAVQTICWFLARQNSTPGFSGQATHKTRQRVEGREGNLSAGSFHSEPYIPVFITAGEV